MSLAIVWKVAEVNGTTFQSRFIFQTGLISLRVSCKRAHRALVHMRTS